MKISDAIVTFGVDFISLYLNLIFNLDWQKNNWIISAVELHFPERLINDEKHVSTY